MAATQAAFQSSSIFQSLLEGVARRIDDVSGKRFGNWLKDTTGVATLPGFLAKSDFGVTKALQSPRKPPSLGDLLLETVNYAIEEARERLSTLVSGKFIPTTMQELFSYLKEHSFDLESRINKMTGEFTNYLVDRNSRQAIPAAQVDPSLSHANVMKLEMRSRLRQQIGTDNPADAFESWNGMSWMRDSIQSKFGYTVENNQGYFGRVVAIVSSDVAETQKILDECKRRGIDVIVPSSPETNGNPIPGMPILSRSKSMKAEEVHKGLDHNVLSAKFGGSMTKHHIEMAQKSKSPRMASVAAESVSENDFARMFLKQEKDIEQAEEQEIGFGMGKTKNDVDIIIKTNRNGQMMAWDRISDMEIHSAINCLPYGEYQRVNSENKFVGYTTVGDNGHVAHYDRENREIPSPSGIRTHQQYQTPRSSFAYH